MHARYEKSAVRLPSDVIPRYAETITTIIPRIRRIVG